ncbi:hypothetical protein [Nocardia arthritidis]|uniref:Uncharacterized protein n=1 Tax=Nocardia arthritidis TaxID=228602 RepID=A0A6G9YGU9_9NOCA|nr:hypothetical protein [Nocardia arthritidis]QIS12418.1 hypothetical protein F5544_22785 [Nocardia arthritidis]
MRGRSTTAKPAASAVQLLRHDKVFATDPLTLDDFVRYIDSVVMPALLNS